ncbi:cytochrome P450 [Streptomyces sp. NPDC047525]|uniref:cytochrome P450 n=1 Tax=Streptomyces sp. NPDC047525 TaxID=3155264 RepID=UPI0033E34B88
MSTSSAPSGHRLSPAPPGSSPIAGRAGTASRAVLPSLLAPGVERDPYPVYRALREDFPLFRDELLGAWLLSRYADVRAALGDVRLGPAADGPGPAYRRLIEPVLRAAAERTAHVLARRLAGRREVDLVAEFSAWLPAAAAVAALGLPWEDAARVREWCRTGGLARPVGLHPELNGLLRPHVTRRRVHPGADLLSVLCGARVDGQALSDDAVTGLAGTLLTGGGEATALALASFLANLLDHPAQLDLVRTRPGLIPAAWAESLRRDPPTPVVLRRASAPVALGGTTLPAGAVVACLIGSAGRDPFRFADPDRYDIFRADPAHLAFGAGRHFCPAATLAGLAAECGLRALLDVMPGLRWAPGFRPAPQGLMARAPRLLLVHP